MTTSTNISGIRTVSVPVDDQDAALAYYTDVLGFTTIIDMPTPSGGRFLQLAPGTDAVSISLEPATANIDRATIAIRFATDDAEVAHDKLKGAGVDVDDVLRWPGVPPMFSFRDLDGNTFSITE